MNTASDLTLYLMPVSGTTESKSGSLPEEIPEEQDGLRLLEEGIEERKVLLVFNVE